MSSSRQSSGDSMVFRIDPLHYLYCQDRNTNTTRLVIGPETFIRKENERVISGPTRMVTIPPRNYCVVENPVARDDEGQVVINTDHEVELRIGDSEVRLSQPPFPLYPGEILKQAPTPLKVVLANTALLLRAIADFEDATSTKRTAGDLWLFEGPGTYIPRTEVEIVENITATTILPGQAIRLRAKKECVDRDGTQRVTGEEWQVKRTGAYLPGAYELVVQMDYAYLVSEKVALKLRAKRSFKDCYGKTRRTGEEWLITMADCEAHIPHVYEEVVGEVNITTLSNRQYCVVLDPCDENRVPQLGQRKVIKGEKSFFLQPGEELENDQIEDIHVLGEEEGIIIRAKEEFTDKDKDGKEVKRYPGDKWMIRGPTEYVPRVEVEIVVKRKAIPLDENEGIYVRNNKTGKIRAITGVTYMLDENEELWEKKLPPTVEQLLGVDPLYDRGERGGPTHQQRDRTRVITYRVPHNACAQIFDYKEKLSRVVFGPDLVMLGPDEHFTRLSLSGGKPKKPNVIKSLCLLLGPDFCTDIYVVETSDHARLQLQLSYNWHFEVKDKDDQEEAAQLFSIPDFVGDFCKAIASRVRGAVAGIPFDDFHKNSASIIRSSVFGLDAEGKVRPCFRFPQNNLVITSVDIQSVEPVDQKTRDSLQKSVQLAIEITTNSQEAAAKHEANRLEQQARGALERQKIEDDAAAEEKRKALLELQAVSSAVESTGQAKAEAEALAKASLIEGQSAVDQARLKAEALNIEADAEMRRLQNARESELKFLEAQNKLEVEKARSTADIEVNKFAQCVQAVGSDTLRAMANAGPETQMKLLQSLGLQTTLITDGSTPVNLFNTAQGLIAPASMPHAMGDIKKKRRVEPEYEADD